MVNQPLAMNDENTVEISSAKDTVSINILGCLRGLLFLAIVMGLYFARDFLLPVVLALFVALTLRPSVRKMSKVGVPPGLTAAFIVFMLAAGAGLVIYLLVAPISNWISQAPQLQQSFVQKFSSWQSSISAVVNISEKIKAAAVATGAPAQVQEVVVRESPLPTLFSMITGYPIQILITMIATLVIAVFLLASGDLFYEKLVKILPTLTQRKKALHIVYDIETEVSIYVLTLASINAGLGVVIGLTMQFMGMPSPLLWGLVVFFLNFIPYVGAITGVGLAGFIAIATFDSTSYALLVPLAYMGWSLVESEIVKPQILGRRLEINSVAILLSLAFFSWLWGISGAALAVPVLVSIKVFCDNMDGLSAVAEFLSGRADKPVAMVQEKPAA